MRFFSFPSIRSRLAFWFLIFGLVPLIIGTYITYKQEKQIILDETYLRLETIRDLKVEQFNLWTKTRENDISIISSDFEIRGLEQILEKEEKNKGDIGKIEIADMLLNRYLKNYLDYEELYIADAENGTVQLSTNAENVGKNISMKKHFTVPLESGESYVSQIYFSSSSQKPVMVFSAPIYCLSHNQHIIGILVGKINLEESLYALLMKRKGMGETGETLIVNKEGLALNKLRWAENAPLNLKITAEPATRAKRGETGIIRSRDYRNVEILAAYTYLPKQQWGLVSKQDMSEVRIPIRETLKKFLLLLFITSSAVVMIMFLIVGRTTRPIIELNLLSQKIKNGDYTIRTKPRGKDEIASLSHSVNEMTEAIEFRISMQKSLSEIASLLAEIATIDDFAEKILNKLITTCKANLGAFYILNEVDSVFEPLVSIGADTKLLSSFRATKPEGEFSIPHRSKSIHFLEDLPNDTVFKFQTTTGVAIPKALATIPILTEGYVVAFISIAAFHQFSEQSKTILLQSWNPLNTAYEKILANERTRILAEQLTKINQQLESQTEELQAQSEELQSQTEELQNNSEELQEQNIELEMQKSQVQEANRLKTEFLSNMSHELRTPLNSINALSSVLRKQTNKKLNQEEQEYLEIIERNGKQLLTLINEILDLSKIESGKMDIHLSQVSVITLLDQIKDTFLLLSKNKGVDFNITVPDTMPRVETDELRFNQVLTNIVANAVKFTNSGSINIIATYVSDSISIEVKDTGIGISENVLPYIFDEFRQADGSSSRKFEGTGLGLSISKKLLDILGGRIEVKSNSGKGSSFTIVLPRSFNKALYSPDLIGDFDNKYPESSYKKPWFTSANDKEEKSILLVEDNPDAIVQLKSILEKNNYKVEIAMGGKAAIDFLKKHSPDGILLDLMMPEVDGFGVLNYLKESMSLENIPVIVLTAKDLTDQEIGKLKSFNIKQLIHKGDIDIEGLLFSLNFMLSKETDTDLIQQAPHVAKKVPGNSPSFIRNTNKKKLLVIEENPDHMIAIRAMLQDQYELIEIDDLNLILPITISQNPDLILININYKKAEDKKMLHLLKETPETKNIPVIVISANVMHEDREKIMDLDCEAFISKPIDAGQLKYEINNLIKE